MRAGPLSNEKVIELLNRYFVPVYVSNEDYVQDGPASLEERAERNRIWREAGQAGLSSGTVHAYVLDPDGRVIDSRHVAKAAQVEETLAMLEGAIAKLSVKPAAPLVSPTAQAQRPDCDANSLVLHLTSRYLRKQGEEFVPLSDAGLGNSRHGSWAAYPAENWIVFDQTDARKLMPTGDVAVGNTWTMDRALTARLFVHFYPSTECNDVSRNRIDEQDLSASVVSVEKGIVRARLTGRLKMKHNFYPGREDQNFVNATVDGYLDYDSATKQIRAFRLLTVDARYANHIFGVAAREAR